MGAVSKGAPLFVVPFLTENNNNYLKSEPDYAIKLDAVMVHGNDFVSIPFIYKTFYYNVHVSNDLKTLGFKAA